MYIYICVYICNILYHGFEVYMANLQPEARDISPRRSRGLISRGEGCIFTIYTSKLRYRLYGPYFPIFPLFSSRHH